jgi:hypothetical protein
MSKVMSTSFNRFYAMKNRLINLSMGAVILFGWQAKVHGDAVCNPPANSITPFTINATQTKLCLNDTTTVVLHWKCTACPVDSSSCKQTIESSAPSSVLSIISTPTTWHECEEGTKTVTVKGIGPGTAILTLKFWGYDASRTPQEWVLKWASVEITVLKVDIEEPDGTPIQTIQAGDKYFRTAAPWCFEWQYVHVDNEVVAYHETQLIDGLVDPIPPAQYSWQVNLGLLRNSFKEKPTYVPSHQSVPATMREIQLTLEAFIGGNRYCPHERTLEVYRDHLQRDYQNFGTGIKCGDLVDTPWTFSRYGLVTTMDHSWNCFGSVQHAFNGTGDGSTEWSPSDGFAVSTYDAPIPWDTATAGLQRGDVVEFYHDDVKEHAHACMAPGQMYGANNRPGMLIVFIGSEVYITGKWYWDTCSSQQYFEKFNADYALFRPSWPPYLNRIKVYRRQ